jgi:hypothetical protein
VRLLLAFEEFQLVFDMRSTHLGIPDRRLDGRGSFHRDMPKVISNLLKRPSCLTSTMREIMPQVMEAEIGDEFPLFVIGLSFEGTKPVVDPIFGEVCASLRSKDVLTLLLTSTMLNVVVERTASFVQQINITELLSFMADTHPTDFRADMGINAYGISTGTATAIFFLVRENAYASMFRYNGRGEFNVPYGGISYNRKDLARKIAYMQSPEILQHFANTVIENTDFEAFLQAYTPGADDFIFLDPPYDRIQHLHAKYVR